MHICVTIFRIQLTESWAAPCLPAGSVDTASFFNDTLSSPFFSVPAKSKMVVSVRSNYVKERETKGERERKMGNERDRRELENANQTD